MIDAADLLLYRSRFTTERHLEKDYLQTLLLAELYSRLSEEMVFKGGTALQKVYGLDRFSEDLDFTYNGNDIGTAVRMLDNAVSVFGEQYSLSMRKVPESKDSVTVELRNIHGPLYPVSGQSHIIKLDISTRESVLLPPDLKYISPVYRDMKRFSVYVMNISEIFAEKVRSILTREKARDIYDLYFMLKQRNVASDPALIRKKLSGGEARFSSGALIRKIRSLGAAAWKSELSETVPDLPDFKTVAAYTSKNI